MGKPTRQQVHCSIANCDIVTSGRYHGHVQVYVPKNHPILAMSVPKGTQLRNATMQAGTFEDRERNRRERGKRGKS